MKPSTKKTLKKIYPRYKTNFMNYYEADTFYIEIFTKLRTVVKIKALNEKQAIDRIVEKQDTRTTWSGYTFVDCDYNVVEEKDHETYRLANKKV
jgi:hypothetical protein